MNLPCYATRAYARVAHEMMDPRELEASLLLKASAKLQAVMDEWVQKPPQALSDALLYNRRLWIIFIDAVIRDENKLPIPIRQNILNLGIFVMAETFSLMAAPKQEHLANLIRINRAIAAGLASKAGKGEAQRAAYPLRRAL
jgi:flagellar biosynthesis activator protein FlaF